MALCGCFPECTCQLNVEPPELLTLAGNGDPASGGWILTAIETAFSAINNDGAILITPGGAYGHSPEFDLIYADTDSVDLSIGGGGLEASVRIDPASPVPIDITVDGLSISSVPSAAGGLFPGVVLDYYGSSAPSGWLLCYGQLVPIATYTDLFNAIGHNGNAGVDPGGGQFRIPDLRGRVTVGLDDMGGADAGRIAAANTLGGTGGLEAVQLAVSNLAAHSHTVTDPGHTHTANNPAHSHTASSAASGSHSHQPGVGTRSFVTATTANITNVEVNGTAPANVTRWVAGSSGGATVQQLDLGIGHSIVVSGAGADFDTAGAQLNNTNTDTVADHTHTITVNSAATAVTVNSASTGITVPTSGGSGAALGVAHENLQPYQLTNKIIKT